MQGERAGEVRKVRLGHLPGRGVQPSVYSVCLFPGMFKSQGGSVCSWGVLRGGQRQSRCTISVPVLVPTVCGSANAQSDM